MRLDHLLSTENSVHGFVDSVCPERVEWFHVSFGDAGVEEIIGLSGGSSFGWSFPAEVVWICFWAPGPPPHSLWIVVRFVAHAE